MKRRKEIDEFYNEIIANKSVEGVSKFYCSTKEELTQEEQIKYYSALLKEPWHELHDQIASDFQRFANPITIDILFETASNVENWIDLYEPVARKCTWALADIGTDKAKKKLEVLSHCGNDIIEGYANKRLKNWNTEMYRKGLKLKLLKSRDYLNLDFYSNLLDTIESAGEQVVTGQQTENNVIVYQAFNHPIADYAVEHQKFGGSNYSYNRMTWIKPNFLWMMYRSGWASKPNQERILAISIKKEFFKKLLGEGELTSFKQSNYNDEITWRKYLDQSEVRIQWDPHHRPDGSKLDRKAIQIGIKGDLQKNFGTHQINFIEDITQFVLEQRQYIEKGDSKFLKIPIETKLFITDESIISKLSIKD